MARTPKEAIPPAVRWEVWRRDQFICHYCGAAEGAVTIDHKVPESRGGLTVADNLVSACPKCNGRKGTKPYEVFLTEAKLGKTRAWKIPCGRPRRGRLARSVAWRNEFVGRFAGMAAVIESKPTDAEAVGQAVESFFVWYAAGIFKSILVRTKAYDPETVDCFYVQHDLWSRWVVRSGRWSIYLGATWPVHYMMTASVYAAFQLFWKVLTEKGYKRKGDEWKHLWDARSRPNFDETLSDLIFENYRRERASPDGFAPSLDTRIN